MQKIHKQNKLFIDNIKVTEICYLHFKEKANQIINQSQYEQYNKSLEGNKVYYNC